MPVALVPQSRLQRFNPRLRIDGWRGRGGLDFFDQSLDRECRGRIVTVKSRCFPPAARLPATNSSICASVRSFYCMSMVIVVLAVRSGADVLLGEFAEGPALDDSLSAYDPAPGDSSSGKTRSSPILITDHAAAEFCYALKLRQEVDADLVPAPSTALDAADAVVVLPGRYIAGISMSARSTMAEQSSWVSPFSARIGQMRTSLLASMKRSMRWFVDRVAEHVKVAGLLERFAHFLLEGTGHRLLSSTTRSGSLR
jgi:hypothetical protein